MSAVAQSARRKKAGPKKQKRTWKGWVKLFFSFFLLAALGVFIWGSFEAHRRLNAAAAIIPTLPSVMEELRSAPSYVYSSDGVELFAIQSEYRKGVERVDLPQLVVDATLAAEDKRFYTHPGIDPIALMRIAFLAAKDGKATEGGSTLTMQMAKRIYTSPEKSLERKLQDMALAIKMEETLSKDQILTLYVNESYYGEGAYGIVAAADVYFGKTLDELTISEAATLARCVRRPSDENPRRNMEKSIANRDLVLATMLEEGFITQKEYEEAKAEKIVLRKEKSRVITAKKTAPYFVDYVLHELRQKGVEISRGGYKVYTTLDMGMQEIAVEEVKKALKRESRRKVNQIAYLCTDKGGRILVMVPGVDYQKSQFNMMWQGLGRQPGSSFKPIVYASGIELGAFSSTSGISTSPFMIRDDRGRTRAVEGGANRGRISIASALASSNNTAAVNAQEQVGTRNVIRMAKRTFGLEKSNLPMSQTLALGSGEVYMLEMAAAYSVFQGHGDRFTPYAIERVVSPDGTSTDWRPAIQKRVLSEDTGEAMDLFLRSVVAGGTGRAANIVVNARGKTGTTSDNKDAWFCGYTDQLLAIAWMGREEIVNGRPVAERMAGVMGGTGAAPIWASITKKIQDKYGEKSRSFKGVPRVSKERDEDVEEPEEDTTLPPEQPTDEGGDEGTPGVEITPPPLPGGDNTVPPLSDPGTKPADGGGRPPSSTTGGSTGGGGTGGQSDVVYVTVCADSGQRSTVYCPEAEKRPFVKGTEPRGRCPVHGPR